MKTKKFFSIILIFVMTASIGLTAFAAEFDDVPDEHPYKEAIDFCEAKGYAIGMSDTAFMPDSNLTRGQLAVIWCRILSIREENHTFADVPKLNNYFDTAIIVINSLGMVKGTSETSFSPNDYITREQLALLTKNTYNLGSDNPEAYKQYTDSESISEWARDGINSCINAHVFEGLFDKENFKPQQPVTRAEVCQLIYNISLPVYSITIGELEGGTITASPMKARPGKDITLTIVPDTGKQLKAGTLMYNDTVIEGTTFIMPAKNVTITAIFEDIPVTLESIVVTTQPDKTTYTVGEALDLTGLVITAIYSDDSTIEVTDYTTLPAEGSTLEEEGTVSVEISYTEGDVTKNTSFDVEVIPEEPTGPAVLESIAVTTPPNKTTYTVGETLDLAGLVITATFSDDSTATVVATEYTTTPDSGSTLSTEGPVTVEVSYTHEDVTKTTSFDVQVNSAG